MNTRKTGILLVSIALIGFAVLTGMYITNPFSTASGDLRGRILGYIPFRVASNSMFPTLKAGDFIVVRTSAYFQAEPAAGDVIVFQYPEDTSINYVMRIAGVGGDRVTVRDGKVIRNGRAVDEPYLHIQQDVPEYVKRDVDITVPENMFFVLGDNRHNSRDSRYWGYLSRERIIGKVILKN